MLKQPVNVSTKEDSLLRLERASRSHQMERKCIPYLFSVMMAFSGGTLAGSGAPMNMDLNDYRWENRLLLLFAPSSDADEFKGQKRELQSHWEGVLDRDLIIIEIFRKGDSRLMNDQLSQELAEQLRRQFSVEPNRFEVILIGKDGTVKLRNSEQVPVSDLFGLIDAMPMRQDEMRRKNSQALP